MKQMITDLDIAKAAKTVGQSMRASLPDPKLCAYEPTPEYVDRILALAEMNCSRQYYSDKKLWTKRVAAIFLAGIIGAGAWLSVDAKARDAFFSWVRHIYENSIIYSFFAGERLDELPDCSVNWLPNGFEQTMETGGQASRTKVYSNGSSEIYFDWWLVSDTTENAFLSADAEIRDVRVNEFEGNLLIPEDTEMTSELIWIDNEKGVSFLISAYLDESELIKIAESVSYE